MTDQRTIAPTEDSLCGMTVDVDDARNRGLTAALDGSRLAAAKAWSE